MSLRNKMKFLVGLGILFSLAINCGGRNNGGTTSADSGITGSGTATTAPTVTAISPANAATGAYKDASLQITFDTLVNTATVTLTSTTACTGSVMLSTDSNFGTNTCLTMNQNVSQSGTQITVRAAAALANTTTYYIRITTAVAGSTGLTMKTQFNSQFTTGTGFTPLTGEFGTDCSAGSDTMTAVRAAADGTLAPNLSVPNLTVTAIDKDSYFFVQAGATGPGIFVRDTSHKASDLGLQVGDVVCMTFAARSDYNNLQQISSITAIKKSTGGNSISAQNVTAAVTDDSYEAELVSVTGTLTTKSSSLSGGGYNHTFTYAGGTFTLREMDGSGKLTSFSQGQSLQVITPMTQFGSGYQLYIDNAVGTITESTSGNFNVSSATAASATSVTLVFNNAPTAATATNIANYAGNNGLTISGASLSGVTVTLTTSTQTAGQSYTITVSNVLRNADNATLTTNTGVFSGYVPAASFTTGQVVINEVHIAPASASEEYVELYNTTASPISLNGATIWYKSAAGTPGQASTLTGVIPANGYYTLLRVASPTGYTCSGTLQTSGWGNSGLGNSAGAVVLTVDGTAPTATTDAGVRDVAQWGTNSADWGEGGTTGPVPSANKTIARAPNGIDTNKNGVDFIPSTAANGTCGAANWAGDSTAPTISSTTPANAATGVAVSSTISVTFSESMYVTSVTTANLYLVQGTDCSATSITGTIATTNPNTTFTFPSGTLNTNTQYSICIKSGVQDVALNTLGSDVVRSFTTIAPDVTPPTVASTTPASGASGVAVGSTIAVTFSEAMSTGTVTAQTSAGACSGSVQVSTVANNFSSCIAMTASAPTFSGGNTIATFTPASALSASTTYHIRVTTGVQDVTGNSLATQFTTASAFTTQASDITPPTVSSTTPANTATGIATNSTIIVTFSEAMSTGTITAQTSAGACNGSVRISSDNFTSCIAMNTAAPAFSGGNAIATYTPAVPLAAGTTYKIRVTTGVQDAAGNNLATQFETATGFTTGAGGPIYSTDFEDATWQKASYAAADAGPAGSQWNLANVLATNSDASDKKNGARSIRAQQSTTPVTATMLFNVAGATRVDFKYARYATNTGTRIVTLESSIDNGGSWQTVGTAVTTTNGPDSLTTQSYTGLSFGSAVRFRLTFNNAAMRINIDDFEIYN
ncbi:MAG: Ig-like domain-containing protein [Turneriella sp.]|nr:Ig-like domain-containing protein [Turneriella sp.]